MTVFKFMKTLAPSSFPQLGLTEGNARLTFTGPFWSYKKMQMKDQVNWWGVVQTEALFLTHNLMNSYRKVFLRVRLNISKPEIQVFYWDLFFPCNFSLGFEYELSVNFSRLRFLRVPPVIFNYLLGWER